jgi:phosphoglycerate dehydrogenase-like enzyme
MQSLRGLIVLNNDAFRLTYGADELRDIARHVRLIAEPLTTDALVRRPELLHEVEVIFSGWGGPRLSEQFLAAAPLLRAFFYAAGSLSSILSDAVWARDLIVTSAAAANAVPVAEYTLASILFSLKHAFHFARKVREQRNYDPLERNGAPGCYGSIVGLISLGSIGRKLLQLLKPFDLRVIVHDPFLTDAEAEQLGVERVELLELFERSDVVSLHTPQLAETEGMITAKHLRAMKSGATFINTARASIVRQDEMLEVAAARSDLQFVLDVAEPEPPEPSSPLYWLPNIVLTPHIAGSAGAECRRMGRYMVEELERFVAGKPLRWAVSRDSIRNSSHRPFFLSQPRPKVSVTVAPAVSKPVEV